MKHDLARVDRLPADALKPINGSWRRLLLRAIERTGSRTARRRRLPRARLAIALITVVAKVGAVTARAPFPIVTSKHLSQVSPATTAAKRVLHQDDVRQGRAGHVPGWSTDFNKVNDSAAGFHRAQ